MLESFGQTQVRELVLSRKDIEDLVKENILYRLDDFDYSDYEDPIVTWRNDYLTLRFVKKTPTNDTRTVGEKLISSPSFKSFPEVART